MTRRRSIGSSLAGAVACACIAAGCGGGAGPSSRSGSTTSAPNPVATGGVDPCMLLSSSDVDRALGAQLTGQVSGDTCTYSSGTRSLVMMVRAVGDATNRAIALSGHDLVNRLAFHGNGYKGVAGGAFQTATATGAQSILHIVKGATSLDVTLTNIGKHTGSLTPEVVALGRSAAARL